MGRHEEYPVIRNDVDVLMRALRVNEKVSEGNFLSQHSCAAMFSHKVFLKVLIEDKSLSCGSSVKDEFLFVRLLSP